MEAYLKAYEYLKNIKSELKYKNRFFVDKSLQHYIKEYAKDSNNCREYFPKNNHFYRARLYLEEDRYKKYHNSSQAIFAGFDEKNSFVNLTNPTDGRANPDSIPYLYVSTTVNGAIIETRPCANTVVSVAQINLIHPLRILDFGKNLIIVSSDKEDNAAFKADLFLYINQEFSSPNYEEKNGYLLTQYICEYVKILGFDGVRYHSVFASPIHASSAKDVPYANLAIFNYDKCNAVNSKLYFVSKVTPTVKELSPRETDS